MNKTLIKINQNDDNLCISIPKELLEDDECRVDVAVTPMLDSLEINVLITEPDYEETDNHSHYSGFLAV